MTFNYQKKRIANLPKKREIYEAMLVWNEGNQRHQGIILLIFNQHYFYASTGTFIDQGEAPDFYFQKYPEENPVLGFFTWRWILTLGFDHMFSSPVFLGLLALLGASLMACTYTTQIPLVKVARRSEFSQQIMSFKLGQ